MAFPEPVTYLTKQDGYNQESSTLYVMNFTGGLTPHAVLVGNGVTDAKTLTMLGTAGDVLTSNGPGFDPSFQPSSGGGGGGFSIAIVAARVSVRI